jgi:hypothetical protein
MTRETDPDPDARGQRMLDWLLSNWLVLTAGTLVNWLREFHRLPRPTRHKLWIELARSLPKASFKELKKIYREFIVNDEGGR